MSQRAQRLRRVVLAGVAGVATLVSCQRAGPHVNRAPPHDLDAVSAAPDASVSDAERARARRCPIHALPPEDLAVDAPPLGAASVGWSGAEWGVAWSQLVSGESAVYFARLGRDGHRRGAPVRLSEHGYRGLAPALLWNGENWNVAFQGGASRIDEIWMARVDARGTAMGRPQRLTARDRRDAQPSLALSGRRELLAWSAQLEDGRYGVFALLTDRWGSQLGIPIRLADRAERLSSAVIAPNDNGWAVAWMLSRTEAIAVDMARLDAPAERVVGSISRVTLGALGGTDLQARFGVAWDGERYAIAWDEVRDGGPHVFFDSISPRLHPGARPVMLSGAGVSATSPTMIALAPGVFACAWQLERGMGVHTQLGSFDPDGAPVGEVIEVQGNDGYAATPAIARGDDEIGVATASSHGVEFHRVPLGACAR